MTLDESLRCGSCGRDFEPHEQDADVYPDAPCPALDDCPSHWEEVGRMHPDYPEAFPAVGGVTE